MNLSQKAYLWYFYLYSWVEVESVVSFFSSEINDTEKVLGGNRGIAINFFSWFLSLVYNKRRSIVMIEWYLVVVVSGVDFEVEGGCLCWIDEDVLSS